VHTMFGSFLPSSPCPLAYPLHSYINQIFIVQSPCSWFDCKTWNLQGQNDCLCHLCAFTQWQDRWTHLWLWVNVICTTGEVELAWRGRCAALPRIGEKN
jgi:hypothetical protein